MDSLRDTMLSEANLMEEVVQIKELNEKLNCLVYLTTHRYQRFQVVMVQAKNMTTQMKFNYKDIM